MKKVIITGASGFIGGALATALLKNGVTVYGVDISSERLDKMRAYGDFIPIVADFTKYRQLHELISSDEIDVFFHLACAGALGGADLNNYELQLSNAMFACVACEEASAIGCRRFVLISSSYQNVKELKTGTRLSTYGLAKKMAEDLCKIICFNLKMEYNVAVLTNTYGVGDYSCKAVNSIISSIQDNRELKLISGQYKNDWMYIDDTVAGIIAVGGSPNSGIQYYVGHEEIRTFKELITAVRDAIKPRFPLCFGTMEEKTYVDYSNLDASLLKKDTGFEALTDFADSIRKTAEWVKSLNM